MFWLKKILSPLFLPLSFSLILLLLGLFFLWWTHRQKLGKVLASAGVAVLLLFAYPLVPDLLTRPLEQRYPPLMQPQAAGDLRYVVVLGGGHRYDLSVPATGRLRRASAARFLEGMRLYHAFPGSKLILSGGTWLGKVGTARTMAEVALDMGIPSADIIESATPRDTREEALAVQKIVGNEPFALVTSAVHMPRAMLLFKHLGMRPIPAPTDYAVLEEDEWWPDILFPSGQSVSMAESAIHEYLGIWWARFSMGTNP